MKKIAVSQSNIHGKGIFADEDIEKGERIQYIKGHKRKKLARNKKEANSIRTWFGIGRKTWIDPGKNHFCYLNHSCDPNAAIAGTKTLVGLRHIKKGEEILIDYSITDADPLWEMKCRCGSMQCRKIIRSIHSVPSSVFKRHMPYVPQYFQKLYLRSHMHATVKKKQKDGKQRTAAR